MTRLADVWKLLPLLGLLVVIAAIAIVIVRVRRSRASPPVRGSESAVSEEDAAFLDSSHIGLEPFLGAKHLTHFGADAAVRGNDSKSGRR
jgi:hypothetical protein